MYRFGYRYIFICICHVADMNESSPWHKTRVTYTQKSRPSATKEPFARLQTRWSQHTSFRVSQVLHINQVSLTWKSHVPLLQKSPLQDCQRDSYYTPHFEWVIFIWIACHTYEWVMFCNLSCREVGGWGRDPKKCTGRDWGMGSSTI